jgi:putative ABC transport system permease protein
MPTDGVQGTGGLALLTRALADHLFPGQDAIGKVVYTAEQPLTVIGILDTLQISSPGNPDIPIETAQYSVVMPQRLWMPVLNNYIIRARPGTVTATMKEVERRLREADAMRVITEMRPFADTRKNAYRGNRTLTAILVTVSGLLVLVTALGITGLASYWVAQRQRMIGVRRALGARRVDILAYFHSENLLIVGIGVLLGTGLALALNTLLVKAGVPPIAKGWLWGGALAVLVIGQLAVLVPALRAIRVPPALVMRSS